MSIEKTNRQNIIHWLNDITHKGLHPTSRRKYIICLRSYFRWLYEQGILETYPDDLLKSSDMPKKPDYLPRPLPPLADRELQTRLENSTCMYRRGLLLMRRTGLRIGELISLEQNCIRSDFNENKFLKVPLGKLDNERLIPLEDHTVNLIEKLQEEGHRQSKKIWLLETKRFKKTRYDTYVKVIKDACHGLEIDGKMTTHRLRHSYATSLLNGGMSLVGVMKLLGHRDYRMTLRYTAIAEETVRIEYFEALSQIEKKYLSVYSRPSTSLEPDPIKMLSDISRWILKQKLSTRQKQTAKSITKRILRIQTALENIFPHLNTKSRT